MDTFELKPHLLNVSSTIYLVCAVLITAIMGVTVFPKAYTFYLSYPSEPSASQILIAIAFAISVGWIMFILSVVSSRGRKIKVENNLVYFWKRSKIGFGKWSVDKLLDFSKITDITERQ
jgi:hypothetical protein